MNVYILEFNVTLNLMFRRKDGTFMTLNLMFSRKDECLESQI